MVICKFGME